MTRSRLAVLVLALGWVPTLSLVCGARWMAGEPLGAAGRSPIKVTRLYTGSDGKTKVEEFEIPLKPDKPNEEVSDVVDVINLAGNSEIELDEGRKIHMGPGSILLAEDTTGKGHITRVSGTGDRLSL